MALNRGGNIMQRISTAILLSVIMGSAIVAAEPTTTVNSSTAPLSPAEAKRLAKEAWLFGLPLVMFAKQFDYGTYTTKPDGIRAPANQFVHYRKFVDASNRSVVGFNVDNLYS
ncbi:MAG TPA: hypothetical protein VLL51_00160, partial [Gemmatimonadales bacterium]|nr:hypothetical protein [Gemmatimonadales bacterium]